MSKSWLARVQDAIRKSGKTDRELGKESGIDPAQLWRLKQGQRTLTLRSAEKLCRVLGLDLVTKEE
jgi:transcriptional regulator with XRE-family HTH domain